MTQETTIPTTDPNAETEPTPAEPEAQAATDDLSDADREKLTVVVRKERAAAKAAKASAERAEERLAELEANELRRTVAEDKGLSSEQAAFLTGATADEMAASADALLAAFPARNALSRSPLERLRTGATGLSEPGESMESIASKVLD